MGRSSPRDRLKRAADVLDDFYGRPVLTPRLPPVDELVFTVLSQNTADVNTERTFAALREEFPDWSAVRDAPVEHIEATIALGGLAHTKAPRIKRILEALSGRTGAPDLGELDGMSDEEAQAYLVALPGVGPKTAACVLLFALARPVMPVDTHVHRVAGELDGMSDEEAQAYLVALPGVGPKTAACVLLFALARPVMPVDTHVHRVARRLGVIDGRVSAEQAHPLLTELAGPDDAGQIYAVHVGFVRHGRRICRARRPACAECPLAPMCPSAGLV